MIKRIILVGSALLLVAGSLYYFLPPQPKIVESQTPYTFGDPDKKKILIFTSSGGGGHISVSNALIDYLKDDYYLGSAFVFSEVLAKFDVLQRMFGKKVTGEDWWNQMAKRKWNLMLNIAFRLGIMHYKGNKKKIVKTLTKYLQKHKPDLLISVVPLINDMILEVCEKLDIPFLLIPTDLNASNFLQRIKNPTYEKFHLAIPYNDAEIFATIKPAGIPDDQISVTGFPVKQQFFEPRNQNTTRKELNIPEGKPVVMLLMGALGSEEIYEFSRQLSKIQIPIHLIIAIGRSEHLRKPLSKIRFPKHVTYTIMGFTDQIPNLMAVSDLLISKSGSVSINEALYSNLPQLLDGTSTVLEWEKFNLNFVQSHNFGNVIKKHNKIVPMVTDLLTNPEKLENMTKSIKEFQKKDTPNEIRLLIRNMIK